MEERMKILKLLEEGKITAEEATKLLEAIKPEPLHRVIIGSVSDVIDTMCDTLCKACATIKDVMKKKKEEKE